MPRPKSPTGKPSVGGSNTLKQRGMVGTHFPATKTERHIIRAAAKLDREHVNSWLRKIVVAWTAERLAQFRKDGVTAGPADEVEGKAGKPGFVLVNYLLTPKEREEMLMAAELDGVSAYRRIRTLAVEKAEERLARFRKEGK